MKQLISNPFFPPDNALERARKTLLFDTYILRRQFYCTAVVAMYVLFSCLMEPEEKEVS
jgi:hypothetical protein